MRKRKAEEATEHLSALEEDLLSLLSGRELYGLAILDALQDPQGANRSLGVGSLYPALHKLEKLGLVKPRWGEDHTAERGHARRCYYQTTSKGAAALREANERRKRLSDWGATLAKVAVTKLES